MKVKYLFPPVAVLCLWRGYVIAFLTDGATGFLPRGSLVGHAITACVVAICLWLYFGAWKKTGEAEGCSAMLSGGFASLVGWLCAALGLGTSAFLCWSTPFRWHLPVAALSAVGAVCALLLAPSSSPMKRAGGGVDCYLSLGLVSWGVSGLLGIFISNNTIATIPENTMSLLAMAAVTVALFTDAKLRAGAATAKKYMACASAAALLATVAELPAFALRLFGHADKFVTRTAAVDLAIFALIPMLWAGLFSLERYLRGGAELPD